MIIFPLQHSNIYQSALAILSIKKKHPFPPLIGMNSWIPIFQIIYNLLLYLMILMIKFLLIWPAGAPSTRFLYYYDLLF